ncbi:MAG: cytochrome b [Oleiphilaceae bacterium]|nr:cytochrome b [Oleiphilaceae bacterium]
MHLRNSGKGFGLVMVFLHWLVAVAIFGLFGLGYYMVDLTYYDDWYQLAPDIHRSVGVLLFGIVLFRLGWRLADRLPAPLPNHSRFEIVAAHAAHWLLYILIFVASVSGYLISTADGSSIDVFNWFTLPSVTGRARDLETIVGDVHYWSTWALVALSLLHGLAAIKHHVIDKDDTLRRILFPPPGH